MSRYPDNVTARMIDDLWRRTFPPEPPLIEATLEDVAALAAVREASAVFLAALRRHPWTFDATETVSWADHVAEHAAIDRALEAALGEARESLEAVL